MTEDKVCKGCKNLSVIHTTGYWKCWCLLFKYWLRSDGEDTLRSNECIELEEKNEN